MHSMRNALLVTACLTLTAAGYSDTRVAVDHREPGKTVQHQIVLIAKGKVRLERHGEGDDGDSVLLYHQDRNVFYALQPARRSYMEMDPAKLGAVMDDARQRREQMMAQLEQRVAGMPEAQREQMKAMMEKMGQGLPQPEEKPPIRYEDRGDGGSAAGISCRWVVAFRGERKVRDVCVASWSAAGLGEDRDTLLAMQKSMVALSDRLGNLGVFEDEMPEGVPVIIRRYASDGTLGSEQTLSSVNHETASPDAFEVPDGYSRQEFPATSR